MSENNIVYPIIKDARFVNSSLNRIRMQLQDINGSISVAEFVLPAGRQSGVNKFWDRIQSEFDVKKLENDFRALVDRTTKFNKFKAEKEQASKENEKLRILFGRKVEALKLPFVANGPEENKKLIRKCPDLATLNYILHKIADKYIEDNSLSLLDFIEQMEDSMYE